MVATRLSDSQKSELVGRFREGSSSQQLAEAFGCSPNTVIRVVRTELGQAEYERLKGRRSRRRGRPSAEGEDPPETLQTALAIGTPREPDPQPLAATVPVPAPITLSAETVAEDGPAVLAIDDADDFGADDDDLLTADDGDTDDDGDGSFQAFQPIPVLPLEDGAAADTVRLQTLVAAALPASAYLLVDKTVELQARPLSEFPELGRLPAAELQRQALVVYLNPRQAKRQCGRTQRVIKVPDLGVLERTAPYLLAQGISRVVIEGALYALPGS